MAHLSCLYFCLLTPSESLSIVVSSTITTGKMDSKSKFQSKNQVIYIPTLLTGYVFFYVISISGQDRLNNKQISLDD